MKAERVLLRHNEFLLFFIIDFFENASIQWLNENYKNLNQKFI